MASPHPVYESVLTKASEARLPALVRDMPHPVALAGGHAVRYAVEENWMDAFGIGYFGSRDIDTIYLVDPNWTTEELHASAAAKAPARIAALGYKPHGSFRYMLLLDESGNPIDEEPPMAIDDVTIHRLYIDPMVTHIHSELRQLWGFTPVDEPRLTEVFQSEEARSTWAVLGDNVYLPSTPHLVTTKLNSLPQRTKDDKAVKDLCDLYALAAYGGAAMTEIRTTTHRLLANTAQLVQSALGNEHLPEALDHLDITRRDFEAVIGPIALLPRE